MSEEHRSHWPIILPWTLVIVLLVFIVFAFRWLHVVITANGSYISGNIAEAANLEAEHMVDDPGMKVEAVHAKPKFMTPPLAHIPAPPTPEKVGGQ